MLLNVINKNIKAIHSLSGRHGRNICIFIFFVTNCITFAIIILSFEDQLMNDVVFVFLQLYYQNLLIFDSFCYVFCQSLLGEIKYLVLPTVLLDGECDTKSIVVISL